MELAHKSASKSLPAIRPRKLTSIAETSQDWMEHYLDCQELSAGLMASADSGEGVRAFREERKARLIDR